MSTTLTDSAPTPEADTAPAPAAPTAVTRQLVGRGDVIQAVEQSLRGYIAEAQQQGARISLFDAAHAVTDRLIADDFVGVKKAA
ncbi:hypothetical protein [Prescottella equi]|uniref:hypothetical protein n=1 Tax=Rhodococcus hoagii TaxID=43767 RepID=UPI000D0FF431|nr:hypothetical protein [Prescottella equi]AVP71245.1 hypothetical protein C7H75_24495 [Prescottella equi]